MCSINSRDLAAISKRNRQYEEWVRYIFSKEQVSGEQRQAGMNLLKLLRDVLQEEYF